MFCLLIQPTLKISILPSPPMSSMQSDQCPPTCRMIMTSPRETGFTGYAFFCKVEIRLDEIGCSLWIVSMSNIYIHISGFRSGWERQWNLNHKLISSQKQHLPLMRPNFLVQIKLLSHCCLNDQFLQGTLSTAHMKGTHLKGFGFFSAHPRLTTVRLGSLCLDVLAVSSW